MVDLTTKTIRNLFQQQVQQLTKKTVLSKEDLLDYQFSGGWVR